MPTRTIYLPDALDAAVTDAVERGEFENRSKAIQAAAANTFEVNA